MIQEDNALRDGRRRFDDDVHKLIFCVVYSVLLLLTLLSIHVPF